MNEKGELLKKAVNTCNSTLYPDDDKNDPTDDPLPDDNLTSELPTHEHMFGNWNQAQEIFRLHPP